MSTTDEQRLRDAVIKFLKDHDPEGFGCACQPDGSKCGPCTWNERFNPLRAALAQQAPTPAVLPAVRDPVGYVLLPVIPTQPMLQAMRGEKTAGQRWADALKASPTPPATSEPAAPVEGEKLYTGAIPGGTSFD